MVVRVSGEVGDEVSGGVSDEVSDEVSGGGVSEWSE